MTWVPQEISGWGRFPRRQALVDQPADQKGLADSWREPGTVISRGLGRSYGDAALPTVSGGQVLSNRGCARMLAFDPATGDLTAESGVSLAEIIAVFQPRGWFLPTTPGTKFVTLGGAIAADVHGKNHHVDGSFGEHVQSLRLLTATGMVIDCSPQDQSDVFWATIGGMGLTGHVLEARLRLRRVPSAWYRVTYQRAANLDQALEQMREKDADFRYSVAWIDCLARGASLGRSVLMLGNDAEPGELPPAYRDRPYEIPRKGTKSVPVDFPPWVLNSWSVAAFNQLFYLKNGNATKIVDYDTYFYPLDAIHDWNRIYGHRGFVQYQALFPDATAAKGLRAVLEAIGEARLASFLAVLKRSGQAGRGMLSYLFPGYTLALDIPNAGDDLLRLTKRLDAILLAHGGRLYFAKDTLGTAEVVRDMYPRLKEFQMVQRRLDPHGRLRSGLSQRLGLLP